MEKLFWAFIVLFLFNACYQVNEKPKDILAPEIVTEVIFNLYVQKNRTIIDSSRSVFSKHEIKSVVLEEMSIKEEQFDKSMAYYVLQPDIHLEILEAVKSKLNKEKSLLENE